jgi:glycosyltransferase involved in cell wall biosynthesis
MPVHNEILLVDEVCQAVEKAVRKMRELRVTLVDDGSNDGTGKSLQKNLKKVKNTKVILLGTNGGKGRAVREGLREATEEKLIFMDGDLAYSMDHLEPMKESLTKYDVVIGSRSMVPQAQGGLPARRAFLGWGFNRLACFLLGIDYPDTQAGLKGFTQKAAKQLFAKQKLSDFAFDVELLYLCRKLGLSVGQIPAQVSSQHTYKTSQVKLIFDSLKCLQELLLIRWWSWTGAYRLGK